ncbi:MAG TPA: sulfatase [Acidobacteriota bacterium]|jgi:N-acetylglucosamine-6-sulfatase|nr:sulfatase [Acidobacteriota bacterium]
MYKIKILCILCVAIFLAMWMSLYAARSIQTAKQPARPNIVFILTDDQRWDAMSLAGHPFVKTPNIDRIGKEGVQFRNFFVSIPLCSPSRGSFLTGQYAHKHGVTNNGNHNALSHQLITFPRLLQDAGYETAYIGKWHMGNDDTPRPGFDRWISFKGQGAYLNPQLNIDGKEEKAEGYVTDIFNKHAVDFIRRSHSKPFLLYLAHKAVHGPFTPAERHKNLYRDQPIVRAPSAQDTLNGKPVLQRKIENLPPVGPGTGTGDEVIRNQLRALAAVDEGVGDILRALEETKQLDNTIVFFSSDNGYFWGEHGLGDKRAAYEESIRDPLLARFPRLIRAGAVRDQLVLNIDIAPSLLELAGISIPNGADGHSLLPLFKSNTHKWRKSFLTEYFAETGFPRIPTWQAVRTERWKYIHYPELTGMDELYDLRTDPYEMKNLIQDTRTQKTLKEMKGELQRLLK